MRNSLYPWTLRMSAIHQAYGRELSIGIIHFIKKSLFFLCKRYRFTYLWQSRRTIRRIFIIHSRHNRAIHPCLHILGKKRCAEKSKVESLLIIKQLLQFEIGQTLAAIRLIILSLEYQLLCYVQCLVYHNLVTLILFSNANVLLFLVSLFLLSFIYIYLNLLFHYTLQCSQNVLVAQCMEHGQAVSVQKVHNAFIYGLFAKPANLISG